MERCPRPVTALLMAAVTASLALGPAAHADVSAETAQREAQQLVTAAQRLLATDAAEHRAVATIVDRRLAFEALAESVLGDYVERACQDLRKPLGEADYIVLKTRSRFALERALHTRLEQDLTAFVDSLGQARVELVDVRTAGAIVAATVEIASPGVAAQRLRVRIDPASGQVLDAEHRLGTVTAHYRDLLAEARRLQLSPFVAVATLLRQPYAVVEDFGDSVPGGLPFAWRWFDRDQDKPKPYTVVAEAGHRYLQAEDHGESVILLKGAHWDPFDYPTMSWCWRADALPPGGDERRQETNDSVAGVYVVLSKTWLRVPRQVKYVWSTSLPVGTVGRRDRWARPYFVVVESGTERAGRWQLAHVNLLDTYAATYGGEPAAHTEGIAVLTDANSTDAVAAAGYADIRIWRRGAFDAEGAAAACGDLP